MKQKIIKTACYEGHSFLPYLRDLRILGGILLDNKYVNVAIADILQYQKSP